MNTLKKPVIRTGMGDWVYYMSSMTYEQLDNYVKDPEEICDVRELIEETRYQPKDNVDKILEYLQKEEDRFLSTIVLAVYGGSPSWYPGIFEKDGEQYNDIGLLEFSGAEKIFPINGSNKLAAVKKLVETGVYDKEEQVPVIFVSHQNTQEGNERTKRLFESVNCPDL